ncbi:PilC/PilY family type IV pilus protein [Desulfobacula sp.]|uniref:pilus assembly protein n=1 Tax=Desulfobacula sp. TaxID=2593537 RepID=UPI0026260647|nr:PilC/PilY family type IV pilus protein [Desulfobacula sp.]
MKTFTRNKQLYCIFSLFFFVCCSAVFADDTCIFSVTSNEVGPNIVLLLDNGAEMEQVKWHSDYQNETDYTPAVGSAWDVLDNIDSGEAPEILNNWTLVLTDVDEIDYNFEEGADIEELTSGATASVIYKTYSGSTLELEIDSITGSFTVGETVQRYKNKNNIATGKIDRIIEPDDLSGLSIATGANGFFNDNGYAAVEHGGTWYLVKILSTLLPDIYTNGLQADSGNTWIINGKTITLPVQPNAATVTDAETGFEIKDNATRFRYSKNYLNWLFFAEDEGTPLYSGNGSDLSGKSRFYYAKQALMSVAKITANKANFGIYNFTSTTEGSSNVQPLGEVVSTVDDTNYDNNILDPNYINNINNMGTVDYSPLAEGLVSIGEYYNSSSSGIDADYYCQDQYVIVVSSGIPSKDQTWNGTKLCEECSQPTSFGDLDSDDAGIGEGNIRTDESTFSIPLNTEGSTWLDDVSHFFYSNDMVGYVDGFQRVYTYTVGVMAGRESNLFLINTSNNGNGFTNLYDTTDENYGKYHFTADSASGLSSAILAAVNAILTNTSTFTAPVVPVTRTLSGNRIYLALFKPGEGNFWEGDVLKFGIDSTLQIVGKNGQAATYPNGALKDDAVPYWSTKNWSNADFSTSDCTGEGCNYIENSDRHIYTYLGVDNDLTHYSNAFDTSNTTDLTADVLGNPADGRPTIINYIRGGDALDEDGDGKIEENRNLFTGDVLHSEPAVFEYRYANSSSKTYVFFGSNDGMLHAVYDQYDPDVTTPDDEIDYGTEAWGFIPPDLLDRLKEMIEGYGHQFYVDSSPQTYFIDNNADGKVDAAVDQVILVCGLRSGGASYFALDITDPDTPEYLWSIDNTSITELGNTYSEPVFGRVKTSDVDITGTTVMFVGGGYSSDNSSGDAVIVIDVSDGSVVKKWNTTDDASMVYSIPSTVKTVDENDNGFVDKIYVGDMGGQVWRIGNCDAADFPECNENIQNWTAQVILETDNTTYQQKFFYPPSVTLEKGYDLIFVGSGDREDPCADATTDPDTDTIYSFMDSHSAVTLTKEDLVDVTLTSASPPDLDDATGDVDTNLSVDKGWYIDLDPDGEKILARGTIFYKTFYITSYIPNDDPCLPGGEGRLYALNHKTGEPVLSFSGVDSDGDNVPDLERFKSIGGGIPSKPVMVIHEGKQKLFISVGTTPVEDGSDSVEAGIVAIDPKAPLKNFFYLWWKELFN